jgi:hypothetical protein
MSITNDPLPYSHCTTAGATECLLSGRLPRLARYLRARRWNVGKRSQPVLAEAASASQCDISQIETGDGHNVQSAYLVRLAAGLWLLDTLNILLDHTKVLDARDNRLFGAERCQAFWHEANKCSVAADKGLVVREIDLTLEDVRTAVDAEIRAAERDPEFQKRQCAICNIRRASLKRHEK